MRIPSPQSNLRHTLLRQTQEFVSFPIYTRHQFINDVSMSHQRQTQLAGTLPDFIVIGAMKSGTTSLQSYLEQHPMIGLSPKELNFFSKDENWRRGVEWYQQFFQCGDLVQGEVCPGYSKCKVSPGVPERIHSIIPDVKFIYVLRDPVARLISHFRHVIGEDARNRTNEQIFWDSFDNLVNTSCYMAQLEEYLKYFELERFLIVTSEKLRSERRETLRKIFAFLDVDSAFSSDLFDKERHHSSAKVKRNPIGRALVRYPLLRTFESKAKRVVPHSWHPYLGRVIGRSFDKPELNNEQMDAIMQVLRPDTLKLKKLTGYDFDEWGEVVDTRRIR